MGVRPCFNFAALALRVILLGLRVFKEAVFLNTRLLRPAIPGDHDGTTARRRNSFS